MSLPSLQINCQSDEDQRVTSGLFVVNNAWVVNQAVKEVKR